MKKFLLILLSVLTIATTLWADSSQYLNFTAVNGNATLQLVIEEYRGNFDPVSLEYSTDEQATWTAYTIGTTVGLASGNTAYFRATTTNVTFSTFEITSYIFYSFKFTGTIAADGNIMSLLDNTMQKTIVPKYAFCVLFSGCSSLISAPELPADSLGEHCYESMFEKCSSLTAAPELPATKLADYCYCNMFYGDSALTTLPSLPATHLKDWCYQRMFKSCTSLKTLPTLPAKFLADQCYDQMFDRCTSLRIYTEAPGKPWQIPADAVGGGPSWNLDMFKNTGGTFTDDPQIGVTYYVASDPTTEVEVVTENMELAIAPNPVRLGEAAQITVEDGSMVEVYNMNGQCVWQKCDAAGSVNVSGLNEAGVYVVKVTKADGRVETGKLIVE